MMFVSSKSQFSISSAFARLILRGFLASVLSDKEYCVVLKKPVDSFFSNQHSSSIIGLIATNFKSCKGINILGLIGFFTLGTLFLI